MGLVTAKETLIMNCPICKHGLLGSGHATVTLQSNGSTVVFKNVPAEVCGNCAEQYVDEATTSRLLDEVERAARNGVQVEVRSYAA